MDTLRVEYVELPIRAPLILSTGGENMITDGALRESEPMSHEGFFGQRLKADTADA